MALCFASLQLLHPPPSIPPSPRDWQSRPPGRPETFNLLEGSQDPASEFSAPSSGREVGDRTCYVKADRTAGLHNLGNTCFMNSALQCLANIPDVRVLTPAALPSQTSRDRVVAEFQRLMHALWDRRSDTVNPSALRESINGCTSAFGVWEQHDAMEFLEFLINHLAEGSKASGEEAPSASPPRDGQSSTPGANSVQDGDGLAPLSFFTGLLKTTISCPHSSCGTERARVEPITSVKLPSIDPKLSEQDDVTVIVVPAPSSELPIAEHRVFVERAATVETLLDVVTTKAMLARTACLCTTLEEGRLIVWSEHTELKELRQLLKQPVRTTSFLIYELEAEDQALCVKLSADKAEVSDEDERRVCPDDGLAYTFPELKVAFESEYSPEDLRAYWRDAMAVAPSAIPAGAQSAVIVHCRLDSPRLVGRMQLPRGASFTTYIWARK